MTDHVVPLDKRLLTEITFMRLFASVRSPFVRLHAAQQRKRHLTDVAAIRFLTGMCTPMCGQCAQLQKGFLANVAFKKLLTGMHLVVFFEVTRVNERLLANVTFKWLFSGMGSSVDF